MIAYSKRMHLIVLNYSTLIFFFAAKRIKALDSQNDTRSSSQFLPPCDKSNYMNKRATVKSIDLTDCESWQQQTTTDAPVEEPALSPNFPPVDIKIPIGLVPRNSPTEEESQLKSNLSLESQPTKIPKTVSPLQPQIVHPENQNMEFTDISSSINSTIVESEGNRTDIPSMIPSMLIEHDENDENDTSTEAPKHSTNWCPTYFSGNGYACSFNLPFGSSWIQCAYSKPTKVNGQISNELQTCTCMDSDPFWRCKSNAPNSDAFGSSTTTPSIEATTGPPDVVVEATTETPGETNKSSLKSPHPEPPNIATSTSSSDLIGSNKESNPSPTQEIDTLLNIDETDSPSLIPDKSLIANTYINDRESKTLPDPIVSTDEPSIPLSILSSEHPTQVPSDTPIHSSSNISSGDPNSNPMIASSSGLYGEISVNPYPGLTLSPSVSPMYEPTIGSKVSLSFLPSDGPSVLARNPTMNTNNKTSEMSSRVSSSSTTHILSVHPSDGPSLEPSSVVTSPPLPIFTRSPNAISNPPSKQKSATSQLTDLTISFDPTHQPTGSPILTRSLLPSDGPSLEPSDLPTTTPLFVPTRSPIKTLNPTSNQEPATGQVTSSNVSYAPIHQPTAISTPELSLLPSDDSSLLIRNTSTSPNSEPAKNFLNTVNSEPVDSISSLPRDQQINSPTPEPSSSQSLLTRKPFSQRLPPDIFARRTSPPVTIDHTETSTKTPKTLPSSSPTSEISSVQSLQPSIGPSKFSSRAENISDTPSCRNASSVERRMNIFGYLRSLSGYEVIDDPKHPVFMASSWIIDEDQLQVCPEDPNFTQRYVLVLLYFYTSGDNWVRCARNSTTQCPKERFLSDAHECDWGGVTCDSQNFVRKINLDENNMRGSIPQELRYLEQLYELDFDSNNLVGHFPSWVGTMKNLEKLDLDRNILSGPIPEELYSSTTLRYIDIDRNILSGTISSNIGSMSQLVFFQADFNQLIGTVPTEIANIPDLQYLSVFGNGLDESVGIPFEICGLNIQIYANCNMCKSIGDCCTVCLPDDASNYY